jgi:phage terminase small subunit
MTARLLCEYRRDPATMMGVKVRLLMTMLGQLGMNPSDRSRLTMLPQSEESPEDQYF